MTAALRFEARATYKRGTHSHTVTEQIYEAPVGVSLSVSGRTVEADLEVDIPLFEAPPTMHLTHNEVHWELFVRMEAPNAPDDDTTFPLVVGPIVADRMPGGGSER